MPGPAYSVEPLPAFRQLIIDGLEAGSRMHAMHALIEVDVTQPRRLLREHKERTGESLSFTGFIIHCCARTVAEHKRVHAYRDWRNRLILFDDVDVSVPVERQAGSQYDAQQIIVRAAQSKSVAAIHQELRQAQSGAPSADSSGFNLRPYVLIPGFLRRLFFRLVRRFPHIVKQYGGTVMVSSVGMFGSGAGWGLALPGHALTVTVGGLVSRPALVDGRLENREHLCLTLTFDHDTLDGAPAARFAQCFKTLVESGSML
jgi:pyruvate/2-oxoglutarate dehydrogenase complex dihydrolipoamide acyltransferase (E2) component